jgi:hypothetical protein
MRAYAVTAGLLLFLSSVPAQAQIYSWRDATGTLVLSNRQLSLDAKPSPWLTRRCSEQPDPFLVPALTTGTSR